MKRKSLLNHFLAEMKPSMLICGALILMTVPGAGQEISSEWKFECQRKQIAPEYAIDAKNTFHGKPTLTLSGSGKEYADGHWHKLVNVEAQEYFQFRSHFIASKVDEPERSILARIIWQNESGEQVGFTEYPITLPDKTNEGWSIIEQSYKVPPEASKAKLELHYRWDADGMVRFSEVSFQKTTPPKVRMVRVATIHHRPQDSKSTQENLQQFSTLIAQAGTQKADIVCLPEGITIVGTKENYVSASEPIPGTSTQFLGNIARQHHLYIVAGLLEREGDIVYNTSVLIDREGNLAGKYRKVSLPREEIDGGITPGNSFPVFDTDFGKIGMMICWDVTFPEAARTLAQQGAEIIFLPIWGGHLKLAMARALENQVYLVSSTYDMISAVFDLEGNIMKEATNENPVAVVDIDLSQQKLWPWLGDLKSRIPREMPSQKATQIKGD
ncbi:MAG: carbon-nitrogen hydrolase family protein [Bacteroidota bacterium]